NQTIVFPFVVIDPARPIVLFSERADVFSTNGSQQPAVRVIRPGLLVLGVFVIADDPGPTIQLIREKSFAVAIVDDGCNGTTRTAPHRSNCVVTCEIDTGISHLFANERAKLSRQWVAAQIERRLLAARNRDTVLLKLRLLRLAAD